MPRNLSNAVESGGSGGDVSLPTDPTFNSIQSTGTIAAQGVISTPILQPPAGQGLVINANGIQPTAGGTLNISASTLETVNGDISTSNGNVRVQGTGFITSGTTISAVGDVSTGGGGDIVSGRNIYFDGVDVYKRTLVGGIPTDTSYVIYKQLAEKNAANTFTAPNTFSDNLVMSGTGKSFTNPAGTIASDTANITSAITCGTVDCDNGGTNKCSAKEFATRTSGASTTGWAMKQNPPSVPAVFSDNILQFTASQAGSFITVASSDYDPSGGGFPSILIDPVTVANGGRISCAEQIFGTTANRFIIKQDNGGPLNNHLQISAGSASGEVRFRDNGGQSVLRVGNTNVTLGSTIPVSFGSYSFRPVELVLNFTGAVLDANPAPIFNSATTNFTRTNDGATVTLNSQGEAVYHLSIDAGSSSGTTVGSSRFMCSFPYMVSANASGQFVFSGNYCTNITPPAGFTTPVIEGDGTGGPVGSTDYSFAFPSINGTETFNGSIKITT